MVRLKKVFKYILKLIFCYFLSKLFYFNKTDSSILQSAYSVDNCLNNLNNSQMDGLGGSTKSLLSITRRSTLSGRTNNVPAGRISHWAESFDSLMNDPLGVKHFKVCLHALNSIELFLQLLFYNRLVLFYFE